MTPEQRQARARLAAFAQWAQTQDWSARTAPGRAAFLSRFEKEVDPEGRLDPETRAKRAEAAKRAYFTKLALASSRARSGRKKGGGEAVA